MTGLVPAIDVFRACKKVIMATTSAAMTWKGSILTNFERVATATLSPLTLYALTRTPS
jgi:hypothetical protein